MTEFTGQNETGDPLRVMFITTSMPIGGAETLLVNLIRRLDRTRFAPEICCRRHRGTRGVGGYYFEPIH